MKLNELADKPKASGTRKRRGQGQGSGLGKTGGRGMKGYKSRSGSSLNGFEGGQTPIHMRIPKRGFSNRQFAKRWAIINVGRLQEAVDKGLLKAGETLDAKILKEKGLIRRMHSGLRILGQGELKTSLSITATAASPRASKAIEAAGGTIAILPPVIKPSTASPKRTAPTDAPAPTAAPAQTEDKQKDDGEA